MIAVAEALGHEVHHEWRLAPLSRFATLEDLGESACRRLCLGRDRIDEVVAAAAELDMWPVPRDRWFTLWWEPR